MKKRKNKQRKKLLKLLPIIRSIIKGMAEFYPTPSEMLFRPGLSSIFTDRSDMLRRLGIETEPMTEFEKPIPYNHRVIVALAHLKGKYRKIDLEKFYHRIWKEDFRNYCCNGYKFDPRGREIIQPDGRKIIRL